MARGGKRPGAGRKPREGGALVSVSGRIPAELLAWVDEQNGSRSAVILAALDALRARRRYHAPCAAIGDNRRPFYEFRIKQAAAGYYSIGYATPVRWVCCATTPVRAEAERLLLEYRQALVKD